MFIHLFYFMSSLVIRKEYITVQRLQVLNKNNCWSAKVMEVTSAEHG